MSTSIVYCYNNYNTDTYWIICENIKLSCIQNRGSMELLKRWIMKVKVITDSGSGLTKEQAAEYGLDFLPLQVIIEDKAYLDGIDLTVEELYDFIDRGFLPQTSMPPLGMIEEKFDQYKEEGVTDVVLITLSSGLSGTNQAIQASAKWHGIKMHTLDIYTTLAVERYLAISAAKLAQDNVHPDEIVARLKDSIDNSQGFLICQDLDHLSRGGRLTPMAAKLGGMLKIRPILEVSKNTEGKVDVCDKVRTTSKAVKKACSLAIKAVKDIKDYELFVMDSRDEQEALNMLEELHAEYGDITIQRQPICAVIASHTGLHAVAVQYVKKVKGV